MPKSFLDLEPKIRNKIYRYSGVTRSCPIDLAKERDRRWRVEAFLRYHSSLRVPHCKCTPYPEGVRHAFPRVPARLECFCDPVPVPLLVCCKSMFQEVGILLWSQNTFKFQWPGKGCLVIQQLNPSYLPWIRSLHVSLGETGLIHWELESSAEIEALFTIISAKCSVARLNLTLECEVEDSIGFGLLRRHFKKLHGLKSCAIRLGKSIGETVRERETSSNLREHARQMVNLATDNSVWIEGRKSWWHLPKELRVKILRFTDLVFEWRQGWEVDGLLIQDGNGLADKGQSICSWSSTCTCYSVPSAVFAVSRQFALEAREIFFLENRFIFRGDPLKTISFFKRERPEALPFFRKIDLQFQIPDEIREYEEYPPGMCFTTLLGWYDLMLYVSEHLDVQALSLSIDVGFAFAWHVRQRLGQEETLKMLSFFRAIIRPLAQFSRFKELRSFRVFLLCCNEYEAQAEKEVMGGEYDSLSKGKIPDMKRNPYFPHGAPHPRLDWSDETSLG